jgi:DNA-binding NtrC family response regulator
LFLDELGELPAAQQVKLLRVLQERVLSRVGSTIPLRVNLRVVAATHRDLDADVRAGRFREDLFYRVAVIRVQLPALKDRPQDIAPLARALLARVATDLGRRDPGLDASAEKALAGGRWPGNARQLSNALERALVLRPSEDLQPLSADDLRGATAESDPLGGDRLDERPTAAAGALGEKVAALERAEIEAALRRSRGVKSRAATALGLSRPTLDKKLAELGINLWKQAE